MVEWIYLRPAEVSYESEARVAEALRRLESSPEAWLVIWGYYYQDSHGVDREGDFLILGPTGGLLVLEVKSSLPRQFGHTGRWEGGSADNPLHQLNQEWQGVIREVNAKGGAPFVAKMLCVPEIQVAVDAATIQGLPRKWLVAQNDLDDWDTTWQRIFGRKATVPVSKAQRDAVMRAFGPSSVPEEKQAFVSYTERLFRLQFAASFAVLDQLSENRQLLIHGGMGTGKTWHGIEQACRYAADGDGQRVLFLTYNKALTAHLRKQVGLRKLQRGEIVVRGWEELFMELCDVAGQPLNLPLEDRSRQRMQRFYEVDLPQRVLEIARDSLLRSPWPKYDALVVDEGQDHDTVWPDEVTSDELALGGWWMIYQLLLVQGAESPASIFHDVAQRPVFRPSERFSLSELAGIWSQPAHFRLEPAVRYTRPLWQFFRDHANPTTQQMIDSLGNGKGLPEGPEVEMIEASSESDVCQLVEEVITRWRDAGICPPHEILILHAQSELAQSPLGDRGIIAGYNLRECLDDEDGPGTVRHTSIHKAKGLDAQGVILVGLPHPSELASVYDRYSWFMGVSRARQLLAVIGSAHSA